MGGLGRKTFVPKASLSPSAQALDSVVIVMVLLSSPAHHPLTRLMCIDRSCAPLGSLTGSSLLSPSFLLSNSLQRLVERTTKQQASVNNLCRAL